jgi:hypothetical protein
MNVRELPGTVDVGPQGTGAPDRPENAASIPVLAANQKPLHLNRLATEVAMKPDQEDSGAGSRRWRRYWDPGRSAVVLMTTRYLKAFKGRRTILFVGSDARYWEEQRLPPKQLYVI